MTKKVDVVVLGAGVAGCAAAYYLARQGLTVKVVERDSIGSCASGYAVGVLNPLSGTGIPGPMRPMAEAAFNMHEELWPVLAEESGVDFHGQLRPHLELCMSDREVADREAELERWDSVAGFRATWLGPEDVQALEPRVSRQVAGAVMLEHLMIVDSYRLTLALARAAEHYGAEFVSGEVLGLAIDGNHVTGTKLRSGQIESGATVLALGPWTGLASRWLGIEVPVAPLKGQLLYLEGLNPPLEYHLHGPCVIVHKADGKVWIGATEEEVGFDNETTESARDILMRQAISILPSLERQRLLQQTSCLRPVTPDRLPLLGKVPGWDGVYIATGAEKKGILLGPALGRAIADLIFSGETTLPIAAFAPGRFAL